MVAKLKSALFSAFTRAYYGLSGSGLSKVPGVLKVASLLFRLLRTNRSSTAEFEGIKMHVNPNGLPKGFERTFRNYVIHSGHEKLTTEMFKKVVKRGDTVVDLGANIGYFTLLAARLVGSAGKVYAFEPEPINFSLLLRNIELNGYDNIVPVQKAVSDVAGTIKFFLHNEDTGAHTIYQPEHGEKGFVNSIEIKAVALDEFFEGKEHQIDVIKVDVEGAEMLALKGMQRIIRDSENIKMFIEFHPPAIKRSGHSLQEFASLLLQDYRFSILAIGDYTRAKKYLKISTAGEFFKLCEGGETVNLLVDRSR